MSDLISRQDAIDVADAIWATTGDKNVAKVWEMIKNLPSVQPEQAIKDCRNCKHGIYNDFLGICFCYNCHKCTEWNLWEPK